MIKYKLDPDILRRLRHIVETLDLQHVEMSRIYAVKSFGSGARGTLARCHALGKIFQKAMDIRAIYIIEVISEKFDKLSKEDQDEVLIHELMHIPKSFGGGFVHHNVVNDKNVKALHKHYKKLVEENSSGNKYEHLERYLEKSGSSDELVNDNFIEDQDKNIKKRRWF